MSQKLVLKLGDCIERMKEMPDNSIGAVVGDPPYLISFMRSATNKWDDVNEYELSTELQDIHKNQAFHQMWLKEAFRVLKPGGVIKCASATRTFHRLAKAMEEVGFVEIGMDSWIYGSGFPKSLNIGKALDKMAGKEREVVGKYEYPDGGQRKTDRVFSELIGQLHGNKHTPITAPASDLAKKWEGYGTALKPAHEPFLTGRKPE
jgi:site-specific DNA-methyltransferase (adenine-specific)